MPSAPASAATPPDGAAGKAASPRRQNWAVGLLLAGLLTLVIGYRVWESDWMLERQTAHASRAELATMAQRMPGSAIVQYHYGERLADEKQTDAAITALERAHNADPNAVRVVALLGDQLTRQARFQEAGALLADFVKRHPNAAETQYALGVYYYRVYAHPKAVTALQEATRLNPKDARAWRALGEAQRQLGQFAEAVKCYTAALALEPNDVDTQFRRATVAQEARDTKAAEADFRAALKLAPDRADIRYGLGELLAGNRFTPEAQAEAETILKKLAAEHPEIPEANRELGRVYIAQKRWPEAATVLQAYTQAQPNSSDGLYLYATVLRRLHKPDGPTMALYQRAKKLREERSRLLLKVQSEPRNVQARLEQARFLAQHGELAFAILTYERVLHYDANNAEAKQALAELRRRYGGGEPHSQ